jgi:GT2 family glycosyltransferase
MDVSIIIPTRDRPLALTRCVRALSKQETTRRFEVLVVDDGGSPQIRPAHLECIAEARVISSGGVGPGRARNRGVQAAQAPVILFTDDDTAPSPRWIESACAFLEAHPDHVGVEGPTVSPPFDPLYERSIQNNRPGAYWTCNVAYRREALDQLGGFAAVFPAPRGEDLDLGYRALRLGPIGFHPDMVVTHYPAHVTIRDMIRVTRHSPSDLILYRRYPERFPSGVPLRLQLVLALLRYHRGMLRRERAVLIGTPRRFVRFSVVAAGQLILMVFTLLRAREAN